MREEDIVQSINIGTGINQNLHCRGISLGCSVHESSFTPLGEGKMGKL